MAATMAHYEQVTGRKVEHLHYHEVFATWRMATDDPVMRSTILGVLVLDKSPDWDRLCERYERALALLGRPADARLENTAPRGLWAVASALGLVLGTAQAPR